MGSHLFSPQRDDISFLILLKNTGWHFQIHWCFQRLEPCIIYYLVVHIYIYIKFMKCAYTYIYIDIVFFPSPPPNGKRSHQHQQQSYRFCASKTVEVMLITRGTRGDVQPFVALARGRKETCFFLQVFPSLLRDDFLITGKQNEDVETFWPKLSTLFIVQVWSSITTAMWLDQHRNIGGKNTKQCSLQTCWGHPTLNRESLQWVLNPIPSVW